MAFPVTSAVSAFTTNATIAGTTTGARRSLCVHFAFPLIAGWGVWALCKWGEQAFDGMTLFEFMYTQIPYVSDQEIILPMVSNFNRERDVGYSMVEPIDANVPAAKFVFNNGDRCFNWGSMVKDPRTVPMLEAVNYYVGLVGDRTMRTKVMLFFHEGDWRPGLGQVYRRWQRFFDPYNEAIHDRTGVFTCSTVYDAERLPQLVAQAVKTFEVHGHFEDYGDYYLAGRDRWWSISVKEALGRAFLQQAAAGERADRAVNAYLATHTEAEIRAEKTWPDAIARDEDGQPIPSGWYMCHVMNADPRWSFGCFALASARKIAAAYPSLQGFFLDCFRHYEIDFSHDDGVTVVNGKPCFSMNYSYDAIQRTLATRILRPKNLTCFANKPVSVRSMRYCDGQLLEGNGDQYEEKFFWASIAMPLYYMWTRHDAPLDEFLSRAVLHGAYPRSADDAPETIDAYRRYLPLYAAFARRTLCFEPDPLRVPDGSRGKLFVLPDGSYFDGIVNLHVADADHVRWHKRPYAFFRVQHGHDTRRIELRYPRDTQWRRAPFKFDGTFLAVPLPEYTNCAVVRLAVTGKSGRPIGPDRFHQRARMCDDPDAAFEDLKCR